MAKGPMARTVPRVSSALVAAGVLLLLAGLVSGLKGDLISGRKIKQAPAGRSMVTAELEVVAIPLTGSGATAASGRSIKTSITTPPAATAVAASSTLGAGIATPPVAVAASSTPAPTATATPAVPTAAAAPSTAVAATPVSSAPGATTAAGPTGNTSHAASSTPAAPAAAPGTPASGPPATAFGATSLASAPDGGFYASTHVAGAEQHETLALHIATTAHAGFTIPEYCTHDQARELAAEFSRLLAEVPFFTACGDHSWLDDMNKLSPKGSKVMMDVGCNKGYSSAKMFGLWAPELGFNPTTIRERRPEVWCGNCNDCEEAVQPALAKGEGGLTVYCLEPSQTNFAQLILTRNAFFKNNDPSLQWLTMNMAMSNVTGVARFSRECTSEQCALNVLTAHNADLIDTSTLDDFLIKYDIFHVDVLKIDTEGFDAAVLTGAMSSIASGRVGVISFEYHEVGVWREYRLRHVVNWLAGFGYVCYYDGKGSVARLTGCWDNAYEMYAWSNVVCVPRSHALYPALERRSLRFQRMPLLYAPAAGQPAPGQAANAAVDAKGADATAGPA